MHADFDHFLRLMRERDARLIEKWVADMPVTATEIQAARGCPDWLADIDRRLAKQSPAD